MMRWTWPALCALACLLTACGGGRGGQQDVPDSRSAQGFTLSVLPETYSFGGSAEGISLQRSDSAESVELKLVASSAQGLKALYFSVNFDSASFSPAGVEVAERFALQEQRLDLTVSSHRGRLEHGSIVLRPQDGQPGFSGDGVLATLRFVRRPQAAGRSVSTPPRDEAGRGPCDFDPETGTLSWYLCVSGDYDQNGIVAVQDLTPIGINYGDSVPESAPGVPDFTSALDVIDGSRDLVINVQDLTSIGVNFGERVDHYAVFEAATPELYPFDNADSSALEPKDEVPVSAAAGSAELRRRFDVVLEAPVPGSVYWVRPVDPDGAEGTPSLTSSGGSGGTIRGRVLLDTDGDHVGDEGLSEVELHVTPGGQSAFSDSAGNFQLNGVQLGDVIVTPSREGFTFEPVQRTATVPPVVQGMEFVAIQGGTGNHPPQIDSISVTPEQGRPGTVQQLFAEATDPDNDELIYTWSVVSGSGSLLATAGQLSYAYNGYAAPPGVVETVEVELAVDDQQGGIISRRQVFTIEAPTDFQQWHIYDVHTGPDSNTGIRSSLVDADGQPLIYYYNQSESTGDGVHWAIPGTPFGETWLLGGKVGDGGFSGLSALFFDGPDVSGVAAYDDTGGANMLRFYYRTAQGEVAHQSFTVDGLTGCGSNVYAALDPGGQPLLAYHNDLSLASGSLRFARGSGFLSDMWDVPVAVEGEPEVPLLDVGSESSVALIGGVPAVAYYDATLQQLRYARASDAAGSAWADPGPVSAYAVALTDVGHCPVLLEVDGRPGIFFQNYTNSQLLYRRADNASGSSWTNPPASVDNIECSPASRISAALMPNGLPMVVYGNIFGSVRWAQIQDADGELIFSDTIDTPLAGSYINPSIAVVGGHAALTYHHTETQDLRYAIQY